MKQIGAIAALFLVIYIRMFWSSFKGQYLADESSFFYIRDSKWLNDTVFIQNPKRNITGIEIREIAKVVN